MIDKKIDDWNGVFKSSIWYYIITDIKVYRLYLDIEGLFYSKTIMTISDNVDSYAFEQGFKYGDICLNMVKSHCDYPLSLQGFVHDQTTTKAGSYFTLSKNNFEKLIRAIPGHNNNF